MLLEKHNVIEAPIELAYGPTHSQHTKLVALREVLSESRSEDVLSLLEEIARTHGNMRTSVSPRYLHDERWEDLWQCLALEGYQLRNNQLVQIEPTIEGSVAVEDDLIKELSQSSLPKALDIVECINNSAKDFRGTPPDLNPDSHFSFDSANHRVASDAFIYAGWKALKALRRSTPNG